MVLLLGAAVEIFGFVACFVAALLFAFAPLPVYYNRYFIHESLFVTTTLGLILTGWRAVQDKSYLYSALAGFCAGIMLACKETAPLHFLAFGIAALVCRWIQSPEKIAAGFPPLKIIITGCAVFIFTVVLLFTWFGQNPGVFADLFHAIPNYAARAGGEGHEKPFWYYLKLLSDDRSGGIILALAVAGILLVFFTRRGKRPHELDYSTVEGILPRPPHRLFLAIYAVVIFAFYSAIPYKTPWLALNFWLTIPLLAGITVEWLWFATPKCSVRAVILAFVPVLGFLIMHDTRLRVFIEPADENNPYAYAHTVDDLLGLPARIEELSRQRNLPQPRISVVAADAWPLPWYLRKYSQVGYWQPGQEPAPADFYITSLEAAAKMNGQLTNFNPEYFGVRPEVPIILWTPAAAKKSL
jgi:uncharacterized protein (TIGR03663 family)